MNRISQAMDYVCRLAPKKLSVTLFSLVVFSFSLAILPAVAQEDGGEKAAAESAEGGSDADGEKAESEDDGGGESGGDDAALSLGKSVYQNNCLQCHKFGEKVVGPALNGVVGRWPSKDALKKYIKYPMKVINSGEIEQANKVWEEYKPTQMPNHDFLSDKELDAVVAYLASNPSDPGSGGDGGGEETQAAGGEGAAPAASQDSGYLPIILASLVIILLLILVVLILVLTALSSYLRQQQLPEEDKEVVEQRFDPMRWVSHPVIVGAVSFIFIMALAKAGYDWVYGIGVQQGYAPTQPISFSHKLHAGHYEIECEYCHTGVHLGKSAHIPSVNICMNCHNKIRTNSPEIKKLYTAVRKNEPIEWVRIHNLPDLAYFNHSQHVEVGGIECETCHGPIEEMEVVHQHSSLTMGWCINCHRTTVVNAKGNAYYDKLLELHNKDTKEPMYVEDIGGLECSKCHY